MGGWLGIENFERWKCNGIINGEFKRRSEE